MQRIAFIAFCLLSIGILILAVFSETRSSLLSARLEVSGKDSSSSPSQMEDTAGIDRASVSSASSSRKYSAYTSRSLASGSPAILYFAQTGDPFSDRYDARIHLLASSGALRHPVYRVEFGTSTGARITYGVLIPDTFVLVQSGSRVRSVIHPTDAELTALLVSSSLVSPPTR